MQNSQDHGQQKDADLNEMVDQIYRHQSLLAAYASVPRDYGTGYLMTEIEAHTLGFIDGRDGITATQLTQEMNRTKGAISQLMGKLEKKGLVRRETDPANKRINRIYLTPEGKRASDIHKAYDRENMLAMIDKLLGDCSRQDIESFFKVIRHRIRIFEAHSKGEVQEG